MCRSIALKPIQFEFVSIAATINQVITRLSETPPTHEVFVIIRALSGSDLQKGLVRFRKTDVGRSVLKHRRSLMQTLCNQPCWPHFHQRAWGANIRFHKREDLSADGLVEASEEQADALDANSDLALFATRQRDMHDLWHVLTEYGRDELGGRVCWGLYAQNKNRGVGFIALVGCFKLYKRHGFKAINIPWLPGRTPRGLVASARLGSLLHEPITSVRRDLNISRPTLYHSCCSASAFTSQVKEN